MKYWTVGKIDDKTVWVSGTFNITAAAGIRALTHVRETGNKLCRYTMVKQRARPKTAPGSLCRVDGCKEIAVDYYRKTSFCYGHGQDARTDAEWERRNPL